MNVKLAKGTTLWDHKRDCPYVVTETKSRHSNPEPIYYLDPILKRNHKQQFSEEYINILLSNKELEPMPLDKIKEKLAMVSPSMLK